jgi:hypothetical protein
LAGNLVAFVSKRKRWLIPFLSIPLFLFFQNCGFSANITGGGNRSSNNYFEEAGIQTPLGTLLNWTAFEKATQAPAVIYLPNIVVNPFDDSHALVTTLDGLMIYNANTSSVKKILSSPTYKQTYQLIGFPSFSKLGVVAEEMVSSQRRLFIFDINSGDLLFTSNPLSDQYSPCTYNPKDEPAGVILCSFPSPTATNPKEIQAALYNVNSLTLTMLSPIPDAYNLESAWSDDHVYESLNGSSYVYPLPKEVKALVKVYDQQKNLVQLLLSPTDAAVLSPATKYDFNGSGSKMTYANFEVSGNIGFATFNTKCPVDINQYPSGIHFTTRSNNFEKFFCADDGVWTFPYDQINKCTGPNTCVTSQLTVNALPHSPETAAVTFLASTHSFLIPSRPGKFGHAYTLQSIDITTGASTVIPLPVTPENAFLDTMEGHYNFTIFKSSELRVYQDTFVVPYKAFIPELDAVVNLPIVPNSGLNYIDWLGKRNLNGNIFLIGGVHSSNSETGIVVGLNESLEQIPDELIREEENGQNLTSSSKIFFTTAGGQIYSYDILTKVKTTIGQTPSGYTASFCVSSASSNDLMVSYYSNTAGALGKIQVFHDMQVVYDRDAKFNGIRSMLNRSGAWIWFENPGDFGSFIFKYDFTSQHASADAVCVPDTVPGEACDFTSFQTAQGEFIVTAGQDARVFDANANLVSDIGMYAFPFNSSYLPSSDKNLSYVYFIKSKNDGQGELHSLYRFDFQAKKLEQLTNFVPDDYQIMGDLVVTLKSSNDTPNATISHNDRVLMEIPGASEVITSGDSPIAFRQGPYPSSTYSVAYFDELMASRDNLSTSALHLNSINAPDPRATLNVVLGSRAWWSYGYLSYRVYSSPFAH